MSSKREPSQTEIARAEIISAKWGGRPIRVGAPREQKEPWSCGCALVWPILDEEMASDIAAAGGSLNPAICRHEFDAD